MYKNLPRYGHDLSDGFVFAGFRSQPRVVSGISGTSTQLRSDDGATFIELNPTSQKIKIVAPGGLEVDAPMTTFTGEVTVQGLLTYQAGMAGSGGSASSAAITGNVNVTGQIIANGKRVDESHTHTAQGANAVTTAVN